MINAYNAVSTVYALAELEHRVACVDGLLRWHKPEELSFCRREIQQALDFEATMLARAFRDYIAVASAGEARHAVELTTQYWKNFPGRNKSRKQVYPVAKRFVPRSLLVHLVELFEQPWNSGYGGQAWCKIARAGLLYETTPPLLFLDHVVDLSHNGGLFLDKGVVFAELWSPHEYMRLLNTKTYDKRGILGCRLFHVPIHNTAWAVVSRALRLLGLRTLVVKAESPAWDKEHLKWGAKVFTPKYAPSTDYRDENSDYEEEPEYHEEPEYDEEEEETYEQTPQINHYHEQPARQV